jgi:hypothetical protein
MENESVIKFSWSRNTKQLGATFHAALSGLWHMAKKKQISSNAGADNSQPAVASFRKKQHHCVLRGAFWKNRRGTGATVPSPS